MALFHSGTSPGCCIVPHHLNRRNSASQRRYLLACCTGSQAKHCTPVAAAARSEELVARREALSMVGFTTALSSLAFLNDQIAIGAGLPQEEPAKLCDTTCETELENVPTVTTESGLQYKDIKVGTGPSPPVGYQVAANYVAMVPSGKVFDSSLEKGRPYIFRVGVGQVIKGLDEGLLTMKVGGKRRLYVPGTLAFPKGLTAAAGRPRVPPSSPVVFDVSLEYVPGLDDEEE